MSVAIGGEHLTVKQRAALAAEMATMKMGNVKTQKNCDGPNGPPPMSNADAAKASRLDRIYRGLRLSQQRQPARHVAARLPCLAELMALSLA